MIFVMYSHHMIRPDPVNRIDFLIVLHIVSFKIIISIYLPIIIINIYLPMNKDITPPQSCVVNEVIGLREKKIEILIWICFFWTKVVKY